MSQSKNRIYEKKCLCSTQQNTETSTNQVSEVKWSHMCEHFKKHTNERQWWFSSTELLYKHITHKQTELPLAAHNIL